MPLSLMERSQAFLEFLDEWTASLPETDLKSVIKNPAHTAIISVDVINGFCTIGPLSSPRVEAIVQPIVNLFRKAWDLGLRQIVLSQDTHEPDAVEFDAWPRHCVRGTPEAETVDFFKKLPFFDQMVLLEKNSISTGLNAGFNQWLEAHPQVDTFIVVGDCTDLCVYQLAMHLRLDANARQLQRRVIVPANAVDTYDQTIEAAQEVGGLPHAADLHHAFFLYHMALNGIEVVKKLG
ncbi:MAG TPA: isochorismatase family cysteine hydrolase [Bellilinea sp.]|nr:isochorismatase family cysteine hydrolase [Bellilinea sp.]